MDHLSPSTVACLGKCGVFWRWAVSRLFRGGKLAAHIHCTWIPSPGVTAIRWRFLSHVYDPPFGIVHDPAHFIHWGRRAVWVPVDSVKRWKKMLQTGADSWRGRFLKMYYYRQEGDKLTAVGGLCVARDLCGQMKNSSNRGVRRIPLIESDLHILYGHCLLQLVQLLSHVGVCSPMDHSTPDLPVHHQLREFIQTLVHWVRDAIQPSPPLSSPSPPAFSLSQHQGLFPWVSSLHQVVKELEFQLQHQSFQWTLRIDFL